MKNNNKKQYRAMVSSDWNECLSPMGPFDPIIFAYPGLKPDLVSIFRKYTSNRITLHDAVNELQKLMPAPLSAEQMDAYLEKYFVTYKGVPQFIEWCKENNVLFMINTTASIGFFQRAFRMRLLSGIPALSAHPGFRYEPSKYDPAEILELLEITDKSKNTQKIASTHEIPFDKIVIIGDSGGDGPHFAWGSANGAFLVGSMTKWSLESFCSSHGIHIDLHFGLTYGKDEKRNPDKEMQIDFMELTKAVEEVLAR